MEKITLNPDFINQRLDVFVSSYLNISRKDASTAIECGKVLVSGMVKKSSYKLKGGEILEYDPNISVREEIKILPQNIALDIKYEDDGILVINKPKNMLTHPSAHNRSDTLVNALMYHCGENLCDFGDPLRRGIVHRLDKNTAGLILAAKTNDAALSLMEQIKNKTAIRKYLAVALGVFKEPQGVINKDLVHFMGDSVKMNVVENGQGKSAVTYYRVLERFEGAALVELELKTGRTHQIRAHLASINHPVFGDTLYGAKGATIEKYRRIKTLEQVLESYYLSFTHPKNNEIMTFELSSDDWDEDLNKVLKIMRG